MTETINERNQMNVNKLVRHNLKNPLDARLSLEDVQSRTAIARTRGNNAALLAQVHSEIEASKRGPQSKFEQMGEWTPQSDYIPKNDGEWNP